MFLCWFKYVSTQDSDQPTLSQLFSLGFYVIDNQIVLDEDSISQNQAICGAAGFSDIKLSVWIGSMDNQLYYDSLQWRTENELKIDIDWQWILHVLWLLAGYFVSECSCVDETTCDGSQVLSGNVNYCFAGHRYGINRPTRVCVCVYYHLL